MQTTRRTVLASLAAAALPSVAVGSGPKPAFKLGTVTYNIAKDWDIPTLLGVCKNVGIAAVELRTTHKHGVEPTLSPEARQTVRKQFEDAGVVLWGCGSVCEFHSTDPAVVRQNIETCKQFVQLVHDIGGKGVKVRPNGLPDGVPVEKTLEQIGSSLKDCGAAAADAGVEIWVEVHGPGTAHPPHIKTIMNTCGLKNVGVTWNSNPQDIKDGSVKEYFELLRPHILSCHINTLYSDAAGQYPYRELFSLLRDTGYDRYTMIELGKNFPDVPSSEEFLRYYAAYWGELCRALTPPSGVHALP